MREIKFRAWLQFRKKMEYEKIDAPYIYNNLNLLLKNLIIPNTDGEIWCVLMQFTGLKDKNGKEIYEGDIVKLNNNEIAIVEYWVKGGQWVIHTPNFDMEGGQGLYNAHIKQMEHEVIGNIYENPKLLTHPTLTGGKDEG